jgi:hypothetical protein
MSTAIERQQDDRQHITPTNLRRERGWTDGAIKQYLCDADKTYTTRNPYRRGMITVRLYTLALSDL